jgi:hypothetical protein
MVSFLEVFGENSFLRHLNALHDDINLTKFPVDKVCKDMKQPPPSYKLLKDDSYLNSKKDYLHL